MSGIGEREDAFALGQGWVEVMEDGVPTQADQLSGGAEAGEPEGLAASLTVFSQGWSPVLNIALTGRGRLVVFG